MNLPGNMIVKEEVFERTGRGLNGRELPSQGKVVAKKRTSSAQPSDACPRFSTMPRHSTTHNKLSAIGAPLPNRFLSIIMTT